MSSELIISDNEFRSFRDLMRCATGIELSEAKKHLVSGRLSKRLHTLGVRSFGDYYRLVSSGDNQEEYQRMVDLLTTHETYFFREPKHFDYLAESVLPQLCRRSDNSPLRIWSAASSTGEEAYSLAMTLMDKLKLDRPWEILGTDISRDVIIKAQQGIYRTERMDGIPPDYLRRYFLRGIGSKTGTLRVVPEVRQRVRFAQANLNESFAAVGDFDVVFLRNVLIYFDQATKHKIVERVLKQIRKGGWLFIGHSESLNGVTSAVHPVRPTIYRRD
ncbi:MAG: protein-glutamate O-methyltransferase CheR [Cellvibrio sp.]|nr:protein-glutamate O-methyltransferase CheR [Cellvibrio sp.]